MSNVKYFRNTMSLANLSQLFQLGKVEFKKEDLSKAVTDEIISAILKGYPLPTIIAGNFIKKTPVHSYEFKKILANDYIIQTLNDFLSGYIYFDNKTFGKFDEEVKKQIWEYNIELIEMSDYEDEDCQKIIDFHNRLSVIHDNKYGNLGIIVPTKIENEETLFLIKKYKDKDRTCKYELSTCMHNNSYLSMLGCVNEQLREDTGYDVSPNKIKSIGEFLMDNRKVTFYTVDVTNELFHKDDEQEDKDFIATWVDYNTIMYSGNGYMKLFNSCLIKK